MRHILQGSRECTARDMEIWLTTGQIGFAVRREDDELDADDEVEAREPTGRLLAPKISDFIRKYKARSEATGGPDDMWEALEELGAVWGQEADAGEEIKCARRKVWEMPSRPLAMQDPRYLPEVSLTQQLGRNWFLNEEMPTVWQEALRWEECVHGFRV
jgi:hypothetical protein